MAFQKIATKRKSVQVAEQITEAIRKNVYKTGDRLPSERLIAEQMGVSRPSVREALSGLQIAGVLESRAGDGTYVVSRSDREEAGISFLEEEESPVEALDARRVIERAIAQDAAARVTPQTLDRLATTVAALREAAGARDYEAFGTANGDFHLTIIRAAGNELLERTVRPLIEVMQRRLGREMRRREYLDGTYFDTIYAAHEQIYAALKARDAQRAAEAMDHHFDLIEASLRA